MAAADPGSLVRLSLDPVLVPAGFQAGQGGVDDDGSTQVIFCARYDEFRHRYPLLPQASADDPVTCVDLVVDVDADGRPARLDLEGMSLAATLVRAGMGADGEAVSQVGGRPMAEGLPVVAAALSRLFGGPA